MKTAVEHIYELHEKALDRIKVLEEALKKYADEGNWGDWFIGEDGEEFEIPTAYLGGGMDPWTGAKEALDAV